VKDATGGRKPINAKAETVASLPSFRDAYKRRRCLLAIDNFFEWKATKGAKDQAALRHRHEIWRAVRPRRDLGELERPGTEEWMRTFCIITTSANELVAEIHDRMPVIIAPENYDRWLSPIEPDPRDLLVPYPTEPMTMWPISTRVNKPENDDAGILEPIGTGSSPTLL
jgi:putative SOS response-associated peptidase YedK